MGRRLVEGDPQPIGLKPLVAPDLAIGLMAFDHKFVQSAAPARTGGRWIARSNIIEQS
jgi:hypothetical protein